MTTSEHNVGEELNSGEEAIASEEAIVTTRSENETLADGLKRIASVTGNEYRIAVRSRWAIALTATFAVFSLMILTFSGSAVGPAGFERIIASLVNLAVYLLPLAALAFGYDAIVGHEESGWLDVLFALPVSRAHVVIGAFLGRAAVLVAATTIGFGVAGPMLVREFGTGGVDAFAAFLLSSIAVGLAFLSIAVLVSSVVSDKVHGLGIALLVWVWFTLIHDLLALGLVAAFDLPGELLVAMTVTNPADVFRVLTLSQLEIGGGAGFATVLAQTELSTGMLVVALVAWIAVPVGVAAILVRRRRL